MFYHRAHDKPTASECVVAVGSVHSYRQDLHKFVYHWDCGRFKIILQPNYMNKRGSCPESRGFGICVELCSSDMDCSGNQKCCSNGCGHVCSDPVYEEPQSPCDFGSPLSLVFCGRGPTHQDCPKGYSCKIDPVDAYAVCCPEDLCPEEGASNTCFIDPCDVLTCPDFPEARCLPNYCNGCYASFFVGKKNVTNMCEKNDVPPCPQGTTPVNCKANPCDVTKCPQYPSARCVPNYCGGCYAEFFVGEKNVTAKCGVSQTTKSVELCPGGSFPVECLVDPCKYTKCSKHPRASCVANYCGGCHADFFLGKRNVTEECEVIQLCPDGKPPVICIVDPCDVTKCPQHPRASCVANYCYGCNAHFFVGEKNVTKNCNASDLCPDGSQPFKCDPNPCTYTKCPNSNCIPNYCGGCHAGCR